MKDRSKVSENLTPALRPIHKVLISRSYIGVIVRCSIAMNRFGSVGNGNADRVGARFLAGLNNPYLGSMTERDGLAQHLGHGSLEDDPNLVARQEPARDAVRNVVQDQEPHLLGAVPKDAVMNPAQRGLVLHLAPIQLSQYCPNDATRETGFGFRTTMLPGTCWRMTHGYVPDAECPAGDDDDLRADTNAWPDAGPERSKLPSRRRIGAVGEAA